ncbi:MAG: helix-turn-helix domain-containing protein [Opitutales bacterium]
MKVALETVGRDQGSSLRAFHSPGPVFDGSFHYHPEAELVWIQSGQGRRLVGDHFADFTVGEVLLLGPNLPHLFASDPPEPGRPQGVSRAVVVQWLPDFWKTPLSAAPEQSQMSRLLQRAAPGLRFAPASARAVTALLEALPDERGLRRMSTFLGLLDRLDRLPAETLASPAHTPVLNALASERVARACGYVLEHLDQPLSLEQVAAKASLSPSAFSRLFHRVTGRTYQAFVIESRLSRAQALLRETDQSVLDVALASGFQNLANFNRQFRKANACTPRDYRRRFHFSP